MSKHTIIFFLLILSINTPETGPKISFGITETASTEANFPPDPVIESTYRDRAKLCIPEPIDEMYWPPISNAKSLFLNNLIFIAYQPLEFCYALSHYSNVAYFFPPY